MSFSSPVDVRLPFSPQEVPPELQDFAQGVYNAIRALQGNFATINSTVSVDPETMRGDGSVGDPVAVLNPFDYLAVQVFC